MLRRSSRPKQMPTKLQDYHCPMNFPNIPSNTVDSDTSTSFHANIMADLTSFDPNYVASLHNVISEFEPITYNQAKTHPHWVFTMQQELQALHQNWVLTDLPSEKQAIGCKWVFKVKHKVDGYIERYKAILVAKFYNQIKDKDYKHTFSPVVKFATVRTLMAIASIKGWSLHQLDINNADRKSVV